MTAAHVAAATEYFAHNFGDTTTTTLVTPATELAADFCWRKIKRYGRGVGVVRSGAWGPRRRRGPRGSKTPGDTFGKRGCQGYYGIGMCERYGGLYYQKCRPGFKARTCCICSTTRAPVPRGWVRCGIGAATDRKTCGKRIRAQVFSVFSAIASTASLIISAGSSSAAKAAARSAKSSKDGFATAKTAARAAKFADAKAKAASIAADTNDVSDDRAQYFHYYYF